MRILFLVFLPLVARGATHAENPAAQLWAQLEAQRNNLPAFHQEFDVTRTFKTAHGDQSSKWQLIVDGSHENWREKSISGSGNGTKVFDGTNLFSLEDGSPEYIRHKRRSKDNDPLPTPYTIADPDWSKAEILKRQPCGLSNVEHECVVVEFPLKPWSRETGSSYTRMLNGFTRAVLDTQTGLLLSSLSIESISGRNGDYQRKNIYAVKKLTFGGIRDETLFSAPSEEMHEVKQFSAWDAGKIKKQLGGKAAPELVLTDIKGNSISLADQKGKVVLLDFWATWCGPCRADGPALDKLYQKYGEKDLTIVSISVSEERKTVEDFLRQHPHQYPVALTSENEMPRSYQIGVFPTYIIVERDGTIATATEGDKGFSELRNLLKKAGLESE